MFVLRADIGVASRPRPCVVYHQWRAKCTRRDLAGIDQTFAKAGRATGEELVKKNRFLRVVGGVVSVSKALAVDA